MTSISGSAPSSVGVQSQKLLQQSLLDSQKPKEGKKAEIVEESKKTQLAQVKPDVAKSVTGIDSDQNTSVSKSELTSEVNKLDVQTKAVLLNAQESASSVSLAKPAIVEDIVKPKSPEAVKDSPPPPPPQKNVESSNNDQSSDTADGDQNGNVSLTELSVAANASEDKAIDAQASRNVKSVGQAYTAQPKANSVTSIYA